jgi:hypothetical protein
MCQIFCVSAVCVGGVTGRFAPHAHSDKPYSLYIYQTKTFVAIVLVEDGTKVPLFVEPCHNNHRVATT